MSILFVIAVLFGCYSSEAIDDVISDVFDETEMMELIDQEECFYGWHNNVAVDGIYKEFVWEDGEEMFVMHGTMPDGREIYYWTMAKKIGQSV